MCKLSQNKIVSLKSIGTEASHQVYRSINVYMNKMNSGLAWLSLQSRLELLRQAFGIDMSL